jgi:sec-independent protein translocase protein TatB
MLPSLGFQEIVLLGIIARVVVGPKDLPLLLRKIGMWTAKLRGMAQEFRSGFDELARQAELDELRKEVDALRRTTDLRSIGADMTKPLGTLESYAGISPPPPPASTPVVVETPPESEPPSGAAEEISPEVVEAPEAQPVARSAP